MHIQRFINTEASCEDELLVPTLSAKSLLSDPEESRWAMEIAERAADSRRARRDRAKNVASWLRYQLF